MSSSLFFLNLGTDMRISLFSKNMKNLTLFEEQKTNEGCQVGTVWCQNSKPQNNGRRKANLLHSRCARRKTKVEKINVTKVEILVLITLGPTTSSMTRPTTDPSSALVKVGVAMIAAITLAVLLQPHEPNNVVHVAMIGNSMMYYNDLPRLLEAMSAQTLGDNTTQRIHQDSCLHGGADFATHLQSGNGMYAKWKTGSARIWDHAKNYNLYDWGACTPEQLLLGYDDRLEAVMQENGVYTNDDAADEDNEDDGNNNNNRNLYNGDDTWNYDDRITVFFCVSL
jgi:hypothetical protein